MNYYLKIIHNKSILRKIINETTKIAENAFGDIEDIDGFIDESEKQCWPLREIVMPENSSM